MPEDSDIKIFKKIVEEDDDENLTLLAEAMRKQALCGNTPKAKLLGKRIADFSPESNDLGETLDTLMDDKGITLDVKVQLKILMLFAGEYTLFHNLNAICASVAVDSMYETLRTESEPFYRSSAMTTAFTFYRLAEKKENVSETVGESFAELCDAVSNKNIKKLGQDTFDLTCRRIEALIKEYDFV